MKQPSTRLCNLCLPVEAVEWSSGEYQAHNSSLPFKTNYPGLILIKVIDA